MHSELESARLALNAAGRGAVVRGACMTLLRNVPLPEAIRQLERHGKLPLHKAILRKLRAIEAVLEAPLDPDDER